MVGLSYLVNVFVASLTTRYFSMLKGMPESGTAFLDTALEDDIRELTVISNYIIVISYCSM